MSDDDDAEAILTRRQLLVAGALSGLGLGAGSARAQGPEPCLSPPQPTLSAPTRGRLTFSRAPGRRNARPDAIPAAIRDWLMGRIIYAAGGGLTSIPWRVVVSLDGWLHAARGDQPGAPSHGPLPNTRQTVLLSDSLQEILPLADRAWREERRPPPRPTADYDEVVAMRDGNEYFFAQGFGPLRGGAIEELVARLRRATVW